ncbi:MAG: pyridoxal phosphate-dependent aminotransferase [Acidobacteriota bacterium]
MARLAPRTERMAGSPTIRVTTAVDRLRRQGLDVIDFGAGEPDFPTPDHVKAAAHAAIDGNFSKYTPIGGFAELKGAIRQRYRADYGVEYSDAEVIVTAGGKQALYNTALALFGPGDEVVTHRPYWPSIPEQVKLADATPVFAETQAADGFALRAAPIVRMVTARTKGIIVNSPCNPTGALMAEGEFRTIAEACRDRGLWLVVDLCYEHLIYDPVPHNLPRIASEVCRDLTVLCGSASKAYAMTGWRCGWALGPAPVIAASSALQGHATSNVSSITQKAAVAALSGSQAPVTEMLDEYRRRRDQLYDWLTADPRLTCRKPAGAFYLFVDVTAAMAAAGLETSAAFAEALLEDARVAVTPGEAFDAPGFIRISYATSMETLREGSRRLLEFVRARAGAAMAEAPCPK